MTMFASGPLLAALLFADPASAARCPADGAAAADMQGVMLGPRAAPVTIRLYLDPTANIALSTWLDVRALVGMMDGAVAAELVVVRRPDEIWPRSRRPDQDRVRHWLLSASSPEQAEAILREIDRLGWSIVSTRLARPEERAALEARVARTPREVDATCLERELSSESERLAATHLRQLGTSTARPPVFGIVTALSGERLVSNDPNLRDLRPLLELTLQELRAQRPRPLPHPPDRRRVTTSPHAREAVPGGMRVGGVGRPHHLLVYADGERDPMLAGAVGPAIQFRREFPDLLSIQVVARGRRDDAVTLRGRLCAARLVGLEVEYLRRLAGADPGTSDLADRLDLIAERENCAVADEGTNERGAMLDGVPASGADVRQLHLQLEQEAQRGPLRWFWPRTDLR